MTHHLKRAVAKFVFCNSPILVPEYQKPIRPCQYSANLFADDTCHLANLV